MVRQLAQRDLLGPSLTPCRCAPREERVDDHLSHREHECPTQVLADGIDPADDVVNESPFVGDRSRIARQLQLVVWPHNRTPHLCHTHGRSMNRKAPTCTYQSIPCEAINKITSQLQ